MSRSFSVVARNRIDTIQQETVADRVRRLQSEARALAKEHIQTLTQAMLQVKLIAAEIAEGGEAYPVGVRDLAGRMADECDVRVQTVAAITART